ncbi:MAG: sensor histidine kinase [Firmicutes bacterium HGW-Firmicutes-16]|nr:MAG: sensor histidine kinase [Firmicutes bacterium HGW-Firmicutes-16]
MKLPHYDKKSISGRMYTLIKNIFLPMLALSVFILFLLIVYYLQYSSVSSNIIKASGFNQNFKNDVDLKMYYFVSGSSDVLPWEEVQTAQELAETLLTNTKNSESRNAISSVLNLCENLNASIEKIENTTGYDNRMEQLETNIYVITELIEEYIYTYLYYEAGEIASLQQNLKYWLTTEIIVAVLFMIIIATASVKNAFSISKSITDPIDALSTRVEEIGKGDLEEKTPVEADDVKLISLSNGIEQMAGKLDRQIELNRQEQIRLRGIELSLIQAQMNPHFLYNTLDTIVWLIETGKNQEAEEMVTSLSTYFRSSLSHGKDIITLSEETQHVRSYLEIQQVRYKDVLDYEIKMDETLNKCLIPKMTLQPMVENAIYHGLKSKRGKGTIYISSSIAYGSVTIRVEDTGVGMDKEALEKLREQVANGDASGFGLVAAYKRLGLVYGSDYTFTIDSELNAGTAITIRIPYKTEEPNDAND